MLEQILNFIHNYFEKDKYRGRFEIINGAVDTDKLVENQYFYIKGSLFNDGVHQYGVDVLTDEEFEGEIWSMAIPTALISLAEEVETWADKYGDVVNSPFNSESFGGYSYSKSTSSGTGTGGNSGISWQSVFGSRLNAWRKIG